MSGEGGPSSDPWQMKKSSFQWVVNKEVFTGHNDQHSGEFNFGFEEGARWGLSIDHNLPSNRDWVGLYIWCDLTKGSAAVDHIHTKYKIGLISKDDKEMNVKYGNRAFKTGSWGLPRFIKLDSLLAEGNNFFKNDKLTIFCNLEVYRIVEVPDESSLLLDQSQRLESGEFSDFTLVVGEEELKVHRCMLATRSPVFRAMFQHDMKEKQSCRVEIEELDVDGVKGLLEFLYTGRVKDLGKIAKSVLPAADKYGVEGLKILCEQMLCYDLRIANVAELLEFAELHTATRLKGQAITFICENFSQVVKETEFWRLNRSNLFKEVMCTLADKLPSGKPIVKLVGGTNLKSV